MECSPQTLDLPEHNPAQFEANAMQIAPKKYSLKRWTHTVLWANRASKHKNPVAI